MQRILMAALPGTALLALVACGVPQIEVPEAARAVVRPTRGSDAGGTVEFTRVEGGLRVVSHFTGLSPGPHAYHVHVYGDCSAPDATSAGTHFNFLGPSLDPPEGIDRITGNLGELEADEQGRAHHEAVIEHARIAGPASIAGRSVVVHARGNDPDSPPIGAAGPRLACGVIGVMPPPERQD